VFVETTNPDGIVERHMGVYYHVDISLNMRECDRRLRFMDYIYVMSFFCVVVESTQKILHESLLSEVYIDIKAKQSHYRP
jgi:hypothetical protein